MNKGKPAKRLKGKPRGKPFTGKDDPRNNMGGNLNAEAQSYEINWRNALAKNIPPQEFAAIVAEGVRRNRPGYKELAAKYLLGEPTQKIEHSGEVGGKVVVEVVHVNPKNEK